VGFDEIGADHSYKAIVSEQGRCPPENVKRSAVVRGQKAKQGGGDVPHPFFEFAGFPASSKTRAKNLSVSKAGYAC
jgi:hypothetical protein